MAPSPSLPPRVAGRTRWLWLAVPLALAGCGGSSTDNDTVNLVGGGTEGASVDDDPASPSVPDTGSSLPVSDDAGADEGGSDDAGPDVAEPPADPEPAAPTGGASGGTDQAPPEDDPGTGDPTSPEPDDREEEPSDPEAEVPGPTNADGGPVDCAGELPCTWLSADGAVTILMSRLDGENVDGSGSFLADFSVTSTRDTEITLSDASSTTIGGSRIVGNRVVLGGVLGYSTVTLAFDPSEGGTPDAGLTYNGRVVFPNSFSRTETIADNVVLELADSGVATRAVFRNVPRGREATPDVDCADALPCSWSSKDGGVRVTLDSLVTSTGRDDPGKPELAFTVISDRTLSGILGAGTTMVTDSGTSHGTRRLTLGGSSARIYNSTTRFVSSRIEADLPTPGAVVFDEDTGIEDTQARRLALNLHEDRNLPVPRWNPIFRNVPLAP